MKIYSLTTLVNIVSDNLLLQLRERNLLNQKSVRKLINYTKSPFDFLLFQTINPNLCGLFRGPFCVVCELHTHICSLRKYTF